MKRNDLRYYQLVLRIVITVLISCSLSEIIGRAGWLDRIESDFYDNWHAIAGKRTEPKHVAIVAIDNKTLLAHRDEPLVFWGPHFAQAVDVLRTVGAKAIGIDFLFTVSAESWLRKLNLPESEVSRTYDIPLREQLNTGLVTLVGTFSENEKGGVELLLPIDDYLFSLPNREGDVGLANLYTDEDGVARRFIPAVSEDQEPLVPNLTFAALLAVRASDLDPFAKEWTFAGHEISALPQPIIIGFVGPPGTIRPVSLSRVLAPDAEKDPEVMQLRDKVVIIASDHAGAQDIHQTPYARGFLSFGGALMSGAELHANIVETLLAGRAPISIPGWLHFICVILISLVATLLFFRTHPLKGVIVGIVLCAAILVLSFALFIEGLVLPVVEPFMATVFCYLGVLGFRLTSEERERNRLRKMFGQYVSDEVVEKLLSTGKRPDLGGETIEITVLFSDIRNFTTISERLKPSEVVEMLNIYFSRISEPILSEGGTINKFIGDAIMVIWGAPISYEDHACRALRTALIMSGIADDFRRWMKKRFGDKEPPLPEFNIGIGIHSGKAVIGNIGSPKRMEFTAIGDTVNTASRLEGVTKELGVRIAVSAETISAAGAGVKTGKHQNIGVKGRMEKVDVFEFVGFEESMVEKGGNL